MTQGKTHNGLVPGYAIDNDLSTGAVTKIHDGTGWLKLQFKELHFIHKIIIYYWFYTNWYDPSYWCAQSEANFRKCVDNDNNVDVSVYQGEVKLKSCGTLQLTYGLEQPDQIYTLICNTEGDTVKLSKNTGFIAVSEVVVTSTGKIILQIFCCITSTFFVLHHPFPFSYYITLLLLFPNFC